LSIILYGRQFKSRSVHVCALTEVLIPHPEDSTIHCDLLQIKGPYFKLSALHSASDVKAASYILWWLPLTSVYFLSVAFDDVSPSIMTSSLTLTCTVNNLQRNGFTKYSQFHAIRNARSHCRPLYTSILHPLPDAAPKGIKVEGSTLNRLVSWVTLNLPPSPPLPILPSSSVF